MKILSIAGVFNLILLLGAMASTNQYLFIGHPRADGPGEILQREVERVDFSQYDLLMLGGDYTWSPTSVRSTMDYLDAVLDLSDPGVLSVFGNHDTANKSYFTDTTGRPSHYVFQTNNIVFAVLDTTDDGQKILGDELQMLKNTVNSLSNCTHLVLIHHHIIWMADYEPLAYLYDDERIGESSANLENLNFFTDVYPLLLQASSNGVEVVCVGGDRTGSDTEAFHIEHETEDGIHFLAAGCKEELPAEMRTVIEFEHDTDSGSLSWNFLSLTDLPQIPDEPLVISEIHYNEGSANAFVELINYGDDPYDLSGASFSQGLNFSFPDPTLVNPGERIIIAADPGLYESSGARIFELENIDDFIEGEPIWLRDRDYLEVDYVPYKASAPWPSGSGSQGRSLMLIQPSLDNDLPGNWALSDTAGGTPGEKNLSSAICTNLLYSGAEIVMNWTETVAGAQYQLEWTPELFPAQWQSIDATNAVSDTLQLAIESISSSGFFRLHRIFPTYLPPVYTNLITSGSEWAYLDTGIDPGSSWINLTFDDSNWPSGASELGYGDGDEATVVGYGPSSSSKYPTTLFRSRFTIDAPTHVEDIRCRVKVDDGAVIYLNGSEIARIRMQDGPITFSDYTSEGGSEYGFEEIKIAPEALLSGENILAVEVHQASGTSSDISMDLELAIGEAAP